MARRYVYAGASASAVAIALVVLLSSSATATRSDPTPQPVSASPAAVSGRRQLVNILGVLRRRQTKADLDPELLSRLDRPLGALSGSPVLSLVRLATVTSWGDKVFLVPFRPPTRSSIAKLPARLRRLAARRFAREGHGETLGLFDSAGASCCSRPASIEAGDAWMSSGPDPNTLILVAPDGVAKVTILFSRSTASKHLHAETAVVHGNVAAFLAPYPVETLGIEKMTWHGPDGRVIKRIGSSFTS